MKQFYLGQRCRIVRLTGIKAMMNGMECTVEGVGVCVLHSDRVQVRVDGFSYIDGDGVTCFSPDNLEPLRDNGDSYTLMSWNDIPGGHPEKQKERETVEVLNG